MTYFGISNMFGLSEANSRFNRLLTLAEQFYEEGNLLVAVRLAQLAAFSAFPVNAGLFGSPRLEQLLFKIGKQINPKIVSEKVLPAKKPRRVLHILSYAKPIGGDSRFVWRWMQEDNKSQHSLAITSQADINNKYDIPDIFIKSAEHSGGFVKALQSPASNPLSKALELRKLCQNADFVILHLYPYDIVPILALAAGCDFVKVVFINHSDHTFWVGASIAHAVVHLRQQNVDFINMRRGLRDDHMPILPIPIIPSNLSKTRAEAKRLLGFSPHNIILLTIASPFKYFAGEQVSFLELIAPTLKYFPHVILIAVGPEHKGPWKIMSDQTNGRIVALGRRWDNETLYAAADIYLDSVPFSSITSCLEAGSYGIPLLGFRSSNQELGILGPGAPGLDNVMLIADDEETYNNTLNKLIQDENYRLLQGQNIKKEIISMHTGNKWKFIINELYENVLKIDNKGCFLENEDLFNPGKLDYALLQLYEQVQGGTHNRQLIRDFIGTLPYQLRLRLTWWLYMEGFGLCYLNLFPPLFDVIIKVIGRGIKKIYKILL